MNDMLTVWFVRHGQIQANVDRRWHGSTDSALTRTGKKQARRTGRYLKQIQFDHAYTSPLSRCVHTAELILKPQPKVDLIHLGYFAEMHIGDWEDMPFQQLNEQHNFIENLNQDPNYAAPGGESLAEVSARVVQGFNQVVEQHKEDENILVVSHGVAIAILLASLCEQTPAKWTNFPIANCSFTQLQVKQDTAPVLASLNQSFHL